MHSSDTIKFFETHKDKIYPSVKVIFANEDPRKTSIRIKPTENDSPITKMWLGDLAILYVADMGNYFQVLLEWDLPKDVSKEELYKLAVDNLNRNVQFKLYETNFGGYGLGAGGNHEAASICIPGMWDWLADHLNDNLIIGIPAKDLVIIVPESDNDKIENLKLFVHKIFESGERLLTRNITRFNRKTKDWTIIDTVN